MPGDSLEAAAKPGRGWSARVRLQIFQAERLFESWPDFKAALIEQAVLVEIHKMIMAVGLRKDEPLRMILRPANDEVRVPRIVRKEIKTQEFVRAHGAAAVQHIAVAGGKSARLDGIVPDGHVQIYR